MKKIIYPKAQLEKLVIGVTAPSSGLGIELFKRRFDLICEQHRKRGIEVIEGKCLRDDKWYVSGQKAERAADFHAMINNSEIQLIQPPWGGEILIDILEFIDFDLFSKRPKWVQGYSDISTLLLALTVKTGVATAHGTNFMDSLEGQEPLTWGSRDYLCLSAGGEFKQSCSSKWQREFVPFTEKFDTLFDLTEETEWKLIQGKSAKFGGRLLGGCIDTIKHLVGTPYGNVPGFLKDYVGNEGFVLYLENCEQEPVELFRALMSMKYAGWFERVNGIVVGRNAGPDREGFSYLECLRAVFGDSKYPVVWDADIGHKPPQMTLINGAVAEISVKNGKAEVVQKLI